MLIKRTIIIVTFLYTKQLRRQSGRASVRSRCHKESKTDPIRKCDFGTCTLQTFCYLEINAPGGVQGLIFGDYLFHRNI